VKRNVLIITGLIMLVLSACSTGERSQIKGKDASPDALPTIVGSYSVNGFDPLGTEYGGNLTVAPAGGEDRYKLQWIITGSIQEGDGRIDGNKLMVQWHTVEGSGPGASGVTTYTITTEGELYGPRQVEGQAKLGSENAFPNEFE
jgi:hypothetical protein